jgi:hypothetical protein
MPESLSAFQELQGNASSCSGIVQKENNLIQKLTKVILRSSTVKCNYLLHKFRRIIYSNHCELTGKKGTNKDCSLGVVFNFDYTDSFYFLKKIVQIHSTNLCI